LIAQFLYTRRFLISFLFSHTTFNNYFTTIYFGRETIRTQYIRKWILHNNNRYDVSANVYMYWQCESGVCGVELNKYFRRLNIIHDDVPSPTCQTWCRVSLLSIQKQTGDDGDYGCGSSRSLDAAAKLGNFHDRTMLYSGRSFKISNIESL